ncbi:MAG: phosphatidate cytidylyltransferase [Oscillospiraceae bacterium]|nr:phosphatidate cytidylyltransferase [Oscillospiraceae bacterium]
MKKRIIVALVPLPLFFAILFFFPPYILAAAVSLLAAIGSFELMRASNNVIQAPMRPVVYVIIIAVLVPIAVYFSNLVMSAAALMQVTSMLTLFFILLSLLIIDFFLSMKSERRIKWRQLLVIPVAAMVIPYMLSTLIGLRMMTAGHLLVLLPIIVAFLTDSGAYFTGVAIGKHKAFPTISPNKTIEGCIGGLVTGIAGMLIYGFIIDIATLHTVSYPILIIYGLVGAVVTEAGDLVFSLIKRKCGVKDYGSIMPGHGGVLDRFDSMIFTAPTMYLLVAILPAL